MRFIFASVVITCAALTLSACDTPRGNNGDTSYARASNLDKAGRYTEAIEFYRIAANSDGYGARQAAAYRLGDMHLKGEGVGRDPREGIRFIQQAAQGPDQTWRNLANYKLGELTQSGISGYLEPNRIAALEYFEKSAADGHKFATGRIDSLRHLPDVIVQLNKSEYLVRSSGPAPGAMERAYDLFKAHRFEAALPIFTFHAKNGSGEAQYALALMFKNGWGVTADETRFKGWCFMAAQSGHRAAQRELGRIFYRDGELQTSDEEAERWLKRAADQQDVVAINLLGIIALVPADKSRKPNPTLAKKYFEWAAANGSADAMGNLGDMYAGGFGLPRNAEVAKAYYMRAVDAGSSIARTQLFEEFNIVYDGKGKAPAGSPSNTESGTRPPTPAPVTAIPPRLPTPPPAPAKPSLVDLFATLSPSVIRIVTFNIDGKTNEYTGLGSAVVIRPDLVLTNCHVLDDSNAVGTVINRQVMIFDVIGGDTNRDLCLMRPERPMRQVQKTRGFRSLRIGERVFAIGSPMGLENTLSEGIISGLRTDEGIRYIQTSAAVSPGSSGGGLFDENGALIGITTFKAEGENLNFAVAIDESERVIAHFLKK